jgi:hypothetical protein
LLSYELIVKPSDTARRMMLRRVPSSEKKRIETARWGAVLLLQGQVAELVAAVDDGVKRAPVEAVEILGNCPQHIQTVALIGGIAECRASLDGLKEGGRLK